MVQTRQVQQAVRTVHPRKHLWQVAVPERAEPDHVGHVRRHGCALRHPSVSPSCCAGSARPPPPKMHSAYVSAECAPWRSCTGSWPAAGAAAAAARPCRSAWFALHAAAMLMRNVIIPSDTQCAWALRRPTFCGDEVLGLVALLPHHAHKVSRGAAWADVRQH